MPAGMDPLIIGKSPLEFTFPPKSTWQYRGLLEG